MREKWTAKNIPDLSGKVIIVTGANSGLGFEDAKAFARKGAKTILACRNMEKAHKALVKIKSKFPEAQAEIMQIDLGSLNSIKKFIAEFNERFDLLDVLVNNAGIMRVPYQKTVDGFESQVGINHLGHFALTGLLFDILAKTKNSRVVNVSSFGHKYGDMDFDKFLYEEGKVYSRSKAYGRSKLANLLFTYELDRRLKKANLDVLAVASHPGFSNTAMADHMYGGIVKFLRTPFGFLLQSAAKGALPTIRAAVDPKAKGGEYFGIKGLFGSELRGRPVIVKSSRKSHNIEVAKKLWEISEELTGIRFKI
ncbi:MAG: SDR family NAD(P)-dependent oxidoreductase [Candidatus Heimdallarchaeota archaeon]|nr:SDR family NAD(P)-dependent oxidoreductase [Candidatus Heimdallarchaeota archaeon]